MLSFKPKSFKKMKIAKLVEVKPLEKPLLTINPQTVIPQFAGMMLAAIVFLSPFLMALISAFVRHSAVLKKLARYICE